LCSKVINFKWISKKCSLLKRKAKRCRKAGGKGQPAEEAANNSSSLNYSSFYGDEELVDCEPESPARYLCDKGDISLDYDYWPAHGNEPDAIIHSMSDFPAFPADDSNVRSWRRSQNLFREGKAAGALDNTP
jgi:hypothetical protein